MFGGGDGDGDGRNAEDSARGELIWAKMASVLLSNNSLNDCQSDVVWLKPRRWRLEVKNVLVISF